MTFTEATMTKRRRTVPLLLILSIISILMFGRSVEGSGVCFMFYLMADNDLESFLREDIQELMRSSAIRERSLTTWAYIDQRDSSGLAIENIYNKDRTPVNSGDKFSKTMYLNYDHDFGQMIVAGQSAEELDSDDYQTVYNFLTFAMEDCVAQGSSEFMVVFSSHGAGFYGFGGDENKRRRARELELEQEKDQQDELDRPRRRKMAQSNSDIALAIQLALDDHSLGQLDVLGFDACDMSSYVAAQQYAGVAKKYLASEATIPGHGWFFHTLKDVSSAVNMAKDLQNNFLSQKNQYWFHETPKTLALTDLSLFSTSFFVKMEALASHMGTLLSYSQDVDFFAFLQRARAASISFDSTLDLPGSKNPSAVDIGSFLDQLDEQCNPTATSEIRPLLDDAKSAYNEMFVVRGVGPGTKPGTGMHFAFPSKEAYISNTNFISQLLLNDSSTTSRDSFAKTAPEWSSFLKAFYTTSTPSSASSTEGSICTNGASSTVATSGGAFQNSDRLLLNPSFEEAIFGDSIWTQSELAIRTDAVTVDYGLMFAVPSSETDSTGTVTGNGNIVENTGYIGETGITGSVGGNTGNVGGNTGNVGDSGNLGADSSLFDNVPESSDEVSNAISDAIAGAAAGAFDDFFRNRKLQQQQQQSQPQQQKGDFTILYSGTVEGKYDGSLYGATWDATFIELAERDTGAKSRSYVIGEADGDMNIPVFYFPKGVTVDWPEKGISIETATNDLGGQYAELSFGLADVMENDPNAATNIMTSWWDALTGEEEGADGTTSPKSHTWLSLYGQGDDGSNVKRAIPRSENGPEMIVPVMFYTLHEQQPDGEEDVVTSITSLESMAFSWTSQSSLQPIPVKMEDYVLDQKADAAVLEMFAVDYDVLESEPKRAKDTEQFIFPASDFEDSDNWGLLDFFSVGNASFHSQAWCILWVGLQIAAVVASSLFV